MAYNPDDHVTITFCSNGHDYPIEKILERTSRIYYRLPSDNFQFLEDIVEGARQLYDKLPSGKLRYFDATIAGIPERAENVTLMNGGPIVAPDNGSAGSGADGAWRRRVDPKFGTNGDVLEALFVCEQGDVGDGREERGVEGVARDLDGGEHAAAGENDGVDVRRHVAGTQGIDLAGTRRGAADIDAADGFRAAENRGAAGERGAVCRVPHEDTGNVG